MDQAFWWLYPPYGTSWHLPKTTLVFTQWYSNNSEMKKFREIIFFYNILGRVPPITSKWLDHAPNFSKVVVWLVIWKNGLILKFGFDLKWRRVAQFYLVIYSSKMKIWHIFEILGTLHIWYRSNWLSVDEIDFCGKNETLLA